MKRKVQFLLITLMIFMVVLVSLIAGYFLLYTVPNSVQSTFGAPAPGISQSQVLILSTKLFFQRDDLLNPASKNQKEKVFVIQPGDSGSEIANNLVEKGFINNSENFVDYLIYKGIDQRLQSGSYVIPPNTSPRSIADMFTDQNPEDVPFSFPAGWRSQEIAALLPTSGINIAPQDFIDFIKNPPQDFTNQLGSSSLEGFLFPGEYQVLRNSSLDEFVRQLTDAFITNIPFDYEQRAREKGLSLVEAATLASIVEKETVIPDEAPLIASVFLNRLASGMPLQSDPTVQYALGYINESNTWWKNPLSGNDLNVDSPYNTYQVTGLPPAPICNPGLNSLLAVVEAKETDYFYFRAACDGSGSHVFSRTYEEHLAAACP